MRMCMWSIPLPLDHLDTAWQPYSLAGHQQANKGSRIAQLIPFLPQVPRALDVKQGNRGFGSTEASPTGPLSLFTMTLTTDRPQRTVQVTNPRFETPKKLLLTDGSRPRVMLDTGSDVTIFPMMAWPKSWPLIAIKTPITGIGGDATTCQSTHWCIVKDIGENREAKIKPYVMHTTLWILGQDAMWQ
ncbi:hypothetical protein HGM15179_020006 [Zosterops borbonicus]|uniref:Peptidase A2 domain-containing protein n=1 Tax=Zosterops borbonicus TaxID=364589 RepID=A0A8K1FYJ7_9PASS|nr:hypothetical protein HGM15179_020006 [Zosterops borbonicus]